MQEDVVGTGEGGLYAFEGVCRGRRWGAGVDAPSSSRVSESRAWVVVVGKDVKVPVENILGEVDKGFKLIMSNCVFFARSPFPRSLIVNGEQQSTTKDI